MVASHAREDRQMKKTLRLLATTATLGLLCLPGCHRHATPDSGVTGSAVKITLIDEGGWMVITRPLASDRSIEAGLADALREVAAMHLPPGGDPMVIYEGDGRRSVGFPVAVRMEIPPPWSGISTNAGSFAAATVEGGLRAAAARNDEFVLGVRALGHEIIGPVFHRILDDPRITQPEELRIQILAAVND